MHAIGAQKNALKHAREKKCAACTAVLEEADPEAAAAIALVKHIQAAANARRRTGPLLCSITHKES